ncbi:MAG: pantetheine-phosphate adenylyltransferase [Endozoicomonadaceae bacterium]|nr:pantetheine-phosphate adenylyltransferase [Endozoicomonadaceae bacterium]
MTFLYPGTFDPITKGHYDIIQKASQCFPHITIAVANNPKKKTCFTLKERMEFVQLAVKHLKHIQVIGFSNLLIDCAMEYQAQGILRGIRTMSDFEYEMQMANINRQLNPKIESILFMSSPQYTGISSSLVKEIASLGGDISHFLLPEIASALIKKWPIQP